MTDQSAHHADTYGRAPHRRVPKAEYATYFLLISRGIFTKDLGLASLQAPIGMLMLFVPVLIGLCVLLLHKQED